MSYDRSVNIALELRPTGIQEQHRFVPAPLERLQDLAMQEVQLDLPEAPSLGTTRAIAEVAILPNLGDEQNNGQGGGQDTESDSGGDGDGTTNDNPNNGDIRKNQGLAERGAVYTIDAKDGGSGGSGGG